MDVSNFLVHCDGIKRRYCMLPAFVAAFSIGCTGSATSPEKGESATKSKAETKSVDSAKIEPAATPTAAGADSKKPAEIKVETVTAEQLQKKIDDLTAEKKVVFVDFWATWCGPCRQRFPDTVALAKKYEKEGLVVFSVALEEDPAADLKKATDFLRDQNADFPHFISAVSTDESMEAFSIDGGAIPHYRVYGKDGNLVRKFISGDPEQTFSDADIESALRKALELPAETK